MQFRIGVEAISSYKRLSYTPWHAIAEFIDNSTQAYFDNRDVLDAAFKSEKTRLMVNVLYDHQTKTISILDNSIGMNLAEVEVALEVAARPPRATGRSKYGLGMKTSACWFGDTWQIKTKKLGETSEVTILIDVNRIASGEADLTPQIVETNDPKTHYTELSIFNLHKKLPPRTLGKIKRFLASMYRCDLRDGLLELYFQNAPITWEGFEDRILRGSGGALYKKELDFEVLGHSIHGWVAVLGSGSRELAGFTILQNNRVIRGYPDSWRPERVFGQVQGSNDLVNQRLFGELHLESFDVSHTKDDIVWVGEEQEAVEEALHDECRDYRTIAATPYKALGDERLPTAEVVDAAVDQLVKDLKSDQIVDKINLTETPPEEVIDNTFQAVVSQEDVLEPRVDLIVGTRRVRLHLSDRASVNDPYVAIDITPDETIIVVVNMNHPYMIFLDDASAMTDYLRQCVFDALAMNKCLCQ